jgi:DNA-binding CsgD family transcriptional regulator
MGMPEPPPPIARLRLPPITLIAAATMLQAIAALYFMIDGIADIGEAVRSGDAIAAAMESLVAVALLGGVALGSWQLAALRRQDARQQRALDVARGAVADVMAQRFAEWSLSRAEADVALFALKGCTIAEIATLRDAAEGTVRSQLSQIYAKAGVRSQAMLTSQFIEELL